MTGKDVDLPSRLEDLVSSLHCMINHCPHGSLEESQVVFVAWAEVNSEAALLNSPEACQHVLDHKSICRCTIKQEVKLLEENI